MDPTNPEPVEQGGPGGGATGSTAPGRRLGASATVAGLLAGLLAWGVGEGVRVAFEPAFRMSDELRASIETSTAEVYRQKEEHITRQAVAGYGALAGLLGLGLGVAGGIAGRSRPRGMTAGALGLVLGGAAGAAAAYGLCQVFHEAFRASSEAFSKDLLRPLLMHGGMWLPAGLFGGLALGLGLEGWRRALQTAFGGVLGAVVAVAVYEIVGALAFPTSKTAHPVSIGMGARLLAYLSVSLLVSTVAAWSVSNLTLTRTRAASKG